VLVVLNAVALNAEERMRPDAVDSRDAFADRFAAMGVAEDDVLRY
jgi:hypothetical protein